MTAMNDGKSDEHEASPEPEDDFYFAEEVEGVFTDGTFGIALGEMLEALDAEGM